MASLKVSLDAISCKLCAFYADEDSSFINLAACRRFPPTPSDRFATGILKEGIGGAKASLQTKGCGAWPLVGSEDSCGEFQPKAARTEG